MKSGWKDVIWPHMLQQKICYCPWYSVGLCGTCTIGNSMCLLNVNSGPEFQLGWKFKDAEFIYLWDFIFIRVLF